MDICFISAYGVVSGAVGFSLMYAIVRKSFVSFCIVFASILCTSCCPPTMQLISPLQYVTSKSNRILLYSTKFVLITLNDL